MTGSFISPATRERVRNLAVPIATAFGRLGLTPNHLTLIGFGIAVVAGLLASQQSWLLAGLLVLLGGAFDLLDGALARATGRESVFGAFMDSVFDRWAEAVIYVGVAWGCVAAGFGFGAVLTAAALASAVMVSYVRSKSEGLGFTSGSGMANVGLAPREVRIVLLAIGLIAASVAGGVALDIDPALMVLYDPVTPGARILALTLGLIALLATITTIQRILHVRAQAKEG
ncbi:MAG: CDP-alcohol phosphatidyltransferase family protein [Chloroflexi bacterium]|nr:CDP-alcohol phosphatidyltransferase family protein [Chloroflexota bacterium]